MSGKKVIRSRRDSDAKPAPNTLVADFVKSLLIGSGTLLIGTLAVWASPLKTIIQHRIWTESPQIVLTVDTKRLVVGDEIGIEAIISPSSPLEVSEGVLSLAVSSHLEITSAKQLRTPTIVAPLPVGSPAFHVVAVEPGHAKITLHLRTRYGQYVEEQDVRIEPRDETSKPTSSNFSGIWNVALGGYIAEMQIRERAGQIEGTYRVRGGFEEGFVEGIRDGTGLRAAFVRKGVSPFRWTIVSNWKKDAGRIEVRGTATLEQFSGERLNPTAPPVEFYATPRI